MSPIKFLFHSYDKPKNSLNGSRYSFFFGGITAGKPVNENTAMQMTLDKEKSTEKIDGAVAMIMALDRAIRCGSGGGTSVYDERGLFII